MKKRYIILLAVILLMRGGVNQIVKVFERDLSRYKDSRMYLEDVFQKDALENLQPGYMKHVFFEYRFGNDEIAKQEFLEYMDREGVAHLIARLQIALSEGNERERQRCMRKIFNAFISAREKVPGFIKPTRVIAREAKKHQEEIERQQEVFEKTGLPFVGNESWLLGLMHKRVYATDYPDDLVQAIRLFAGLLFMDDKSESSLDYYELDEDLFSLYCGKRMRHDSFEISPYRPSVAKQKNAVYLRLKDGYFDKDKFLDSYFGATYIISDLEEERTYGPFEVGSHCGFPFDRRYVNEEGKRVYDPIASFVVGEGRELIQFSNEEKLVAFVSIYDRYDLHPRYMNGRSLKELMGIASMSKIEMYDRIYFDPVTKKRIDFESLIREKS